MPVAVLEPGVALEVEVEVAGARRRQPQQPEAGLRVEQRARRLAGGPLLQLLGRLLLQPGARVGADAGLLQELGVAVARSCSVAMPAARSASRWSPRMNATRPRSSACRSSLVHRSAQRHCSQ